MVHNPLPITHLPLAIMPGRCPQNQGKTNLALFLLFRDGQRTLAHNHLSLHHRGGRHGQWDGTGRVSFRRSWDH